MIYLVLTGGVRLRGDAQVCLRTGRGSREKGRVSRREGVMKGTTELYRFKRVLPFNIRNTRWSFPRSGMSEITDGESEEIAYRTLRNQTHTPPISGTSIDLGQSSHCPQINTPKITPKSSPSISIPHSSLDVCNKACCRTDLLSLVVT